MKAKRLRELAHWIIYQRRQVVDFIDWPRSVLLWRYRLNPGFDVKYIIGPRKRVNDKRAQRIKDHQVKLQAAAEQAETQLAELRTQLEKWITAGKYSIMGDWIVFDVGQCTCGSPLGPYPHEPYCGVEPVIKLIDAVLPTERKLQP